MTLHYFQCAALALLAICQASPAPAQTPSAPSFTLPSQPSAPLAKPVNLSTLTLAQALQAALNNDDMAVARATAAAAQADVVAANRAPFPNLSAKFGSIDLENGVGDGNVLTEKRIDKGVGIDWTWERGNKRILRTRVAQRAASAALGDLEETQVLQLLAATNAYFDLAAAQERVLQVEAMAGGAAQLASAAARRVSAGDLARQDALRLEIEAERAKGDVLTVALERRRAALALAMVLDLDPHDQSLAVAPKWPTPEAGAKDASANPSASDSTLRALVDARADVRAAQDRVSAAEAAVESASAQKKADVTWGVSYNHFPGSSTALFELRMQMPLQFGYKFEGETARALAQREVAEGTLDKTRRAAGLELQGLRAQLQSAVQRSQGFEQDILPRARQVAAQAELAYTKGALTLNDLLDARRTLRTTGLDALAARADYAKTATAWRLRTRPYAALLDDLNQGN